MDDAEKKLQSGLNRPRMFKEAGGVVVLGAILGLVTQPWTAPDMPWVATPRKLAFAPAETTSPEIDAQEDNSGSESSSVSATPAEPLAVSLDQAWSLFYDGNALFIDARVTRDYVRGHIEGAVSLPYHELDEHLGLLASVAKDSTVVTYCSGADCELSVHLADELVGMGYTSVRVFFGGWPRWVEASYPYQVGESN